MKLFFLYIVIFLVFLNCRENSSFPTFKYSQLDKIYGKNLVVDLDDNGKNDIFTIGGQQESLVLFTNIRDSLWQKTILLSDVYFRGDRAEAGDLDNDGDLDLVAGINVNDSLYIAWVENPKNGISKQWKLNKIGFQGMEKEIPYAYVKDVAIVDFDRDGTLDVVTRTNKRTRIFLQRSTTEWEMAKVINHHNHEGMDVGDLDSDGDVDIVLNGFWFETPENIDDEFKEHVIDQIWFTQKENSWRDDNASVKAIDINGDKILDVLISHSEKPGFPITYYSAQSYQEIKNDKWTTNTIAPVYDFCQTLDAGDIDSDGDIDILAGQFERDYQNEQWRNYPPFPVSVFWNVDGKGIEWKEQIISEKGIYAGLLADIGNDGDLDIVGPRSYWQGPTDIYENKLK